MEIKIATKEGNNALRKVQIVEFIRIPYQEYDVAKIR